MLWLEHLSLQIKSNEFQNNEEGKEREKDRKRRKKETEVNLQKEEDKIVMGWILLPPKIYVDILIPQYPECNYIWR